MFIKLIITSMLMMSLSAQNTTHDAEREGNYEEDDLNSNYNEADYEYYEDYGTEDHYEDDAGDYEDDYPDASNMTKFAESGSIDNYVDTNPITIEECDSTWTAGNHKTKVPKTCEVYKAMKYCADGSYGSGWKNRWGTFEDYADSKGRTALICPECGCEGDRQGYRPRPDGRCGKSLSGKSFHLNGFPGHCNRTGPAPCCSNWGWCGGSTGHCSCNGCKDWRKTNCLNECKITPWFGHYYCPKLCQPTATTTPIANRQSPIDDGDWEPEKEDDME